MGRAILAAIVESSEDAIISKTLAGIITTWNRSAERMFGYTVDEAIGSSITILIPADRHDEEISILQRLGKGQRVGSYETIRRGKDGRDIPVSLSVSPVKDGEGRIVGAAKIVRDISERKKAEQKAQIQGAELVHLSRLDAMGKMSVGLAHELKQPLGAIMNYTSAALAMIRQGMASPAEIVPALTAVVESARRAGDVIARLRGFVRKGEVRRQPVDLNRSVADALQLMDGQLRDSGITTRLNLKTPLPAVQADAVQIVQVLVNLIQNASDAMLAPGAVGRLLHIETRTESNGVVLEVRDQGCGLKNQGLERIFEPFVSSKPTGLGMGLAICRSIVEELGGKLWASRNEQGGMMFSFTLPMAEVVSDD